MRRQFCHEHGIPLIERRDAPPRVPGVWTPDYIPPLDPDIGRKRIIRDPREIQKQYAAIARVTNAKSNVSHAAQATTPTAAFNATAGNFIIVGIRAAPTAGPAITSVTDTAANTYTALVTDTTQDPWVWIYTAKNITGNASNVVTVNWSPSASYSWAEAIQYSGVHLTAPTESSGSNPQPAATDCVSTGVTTVNANDMIVMFVSQNNFANYVAGTGFTLIDGGIGSSEGEKFGGAEEKLLSGTVTGEIEHITSDTSLQYTTVWAALIPAAVVGVDVPSVVSAAITRRTEMVSY